MLRIPEKGMKKYKTRWVQGFWAGKSEFNDDHFLITSDGCMAGRTVHRLPERPTDVEAAVGCRVLPWGPKGLAASQPEEDAAPDSSVPPLPAPPARARKAQAKPKAAPEMQPEDSDSSGASSSDEDKADDGP
eukprot:1946087-Alexandrium_andersonii.AAC.1